MYKMILVDFEKCVGCRNCALACSLAKEGSFSLAKARLKTLWIPPLGINMPMPCLHCFKPICADVCPMEAISFNENTGAVVINEDRCIGCKMCVIACPLGAPVVKPEEKTVVKCDLCEGDPECVKYCVYGALKLVMADEAAYIKRKVEIEKFAETLRKLV